MRTRWKVGIVVGLVAVVGAAVAGVALADGGKSSPKPQAAPAGPVRSAVDALATCARDQGLDGVVQRALSGQLGPAEIASALAAAQACQDEVDALKQAVRTAAADPGSLLRQTATDAAACLDREGVTLSSLVGALGGDQAQADAVRSAAESCLPSLTATP